MAALEARCERMINVAFHAEWFEPLLLATAHFHHFDWTTYSQCAWVARSCDTVEHVLRVFNLERHTAAILAAAPGLDFDAFRLVELGIVEDEYADEFDKLVVAIAQTSAPWVTALDKLLKRSLGLRCPVLSLKS